MPLVGVSRRPRMERSVDLPHPEGPEIENVFSLFDVEVNARESVRFYLVGVENLGDSFEMNECGLIRQPFPCRPFLSY